MYFKLAFKNIKKSYKNYVIYFLTLIFGICIFYTFNSIESQSVMMELNEQKQSAFMMAEQLIGSVYYTHLRAHENKANLVCRLMLEKKKTGYNKMTERK